MSPSGKSKVSDFFAAWKRFGMRMGEYVSIGLFAILYVIGFAPIALIQKMLGKKFLPCFEKDAKSYFLPKDKIEPTMEFLKRQW
jgi:hypothetical protein